MATPMQQVDALRADVDRLMTLVDVNERKRLAELAEVEAKASREIGALKIKNADLKAAVASRDGGGNGRKKYDETVTTKNFILTTVDNDKKKFMAGMKSISTLMAGHGFSFVKKCLEWAAKQKKEITSAAYNQHARDMYWTDDQGEEHMALSKVLRMYLDLYTEGKAGGIVEGVTGNEKNNGIEAWRLRSERYDPKNAAQAMQIQKDAMNISEAKNNEDIWKNILELEKLERNFIANHKDKKGFDEMTQTCIMHQIFPESISQQILLQDRNKDKALDYEELKAGVLTFLATMPGGSLPMVANMEKENEYKHEDYGAHEEDDGWAG